MTNVPEDLIPDSARDTMEELADAEQPYGEVTAEDLSHQDLVGDGADLLIGEPNAATLHPAEDDSAEETIDERILQEEYDPTSAIVPPGPGDLTDADTEAEQLEVADDVVGDTPLDEN